MKNAKVKGKGCKVAVNMQCEDEKAMYVIVSVHPPTSWQADKIPHDAPGQVTERLRDMTEENAENAPTIVMGGELN